MDSLGKIVAMLLCIVFLFFMPIVNYSQRVDTLMTTKAQSVVSDFVAEIQREGFLTDTMYARFIENLDSTGNVYNVQIVHRHLIIDPKYLSNTTDSVETTLTSEYYSETYTDSIIASLYENTPGIYNFSTNDYVTVTVSNKNYTLSAKLLRLINSAAVGENQIVVTDGGVIY